MSVPETFTLNFHYGGISNYEDGILSYIGGFTNKVVVDPDYMEWTMFTDFCKEQKVCGEVEEVWYKSAEEAMYSVKSIKDNKDAQIRDLCAEGLRTGEMDVYIESGVSRPLIGNVPHVEPEPEPEHQEEEAPFVGQYEEAPFVDQHEEDVVPSEEEEYQEAEDEFEEESDVDEDNDSEDEEVSKSVGNDGTKGDEDEEVSKSVGKDGNEEEEMLQDGRSDPRFENLFEEARNEENVEGRKASGDQVREDDPEGDIEDEEEFDKQCGDADRPEPALDTDEEWEETNKHESEMSKKAYQREKPPYFWLMQTFRSGEEFKDQLLRYVLKTNYDVKLCRWEQQKLAAVCTEPNCEWRIYCSVEQSCQKWMVKVYKDKHEHGISGRAKMLKEGVIARLFKDEARRRPDISWSEIKDEIMIRWHLSVTKWICMKARRRALDMVIQTQREQFAKLWDYEAELKRSNPNTTTEIVTIRKEDGTTMFDKFYICFEALRTTWRRCCRPIIGLDGAFLKWELKGELLAAVGRDADNRIYPIAWAVVRVEDTETWTWFVSKLKTDLNLEMGKGLTIISDRQKGLLSAVDTLLPDAEHRNCARHVYANWRKVFSDSEYEGWFWGIAYSYSQGDYRYNTEAFKKFDPLASEALMKTEPNTWCRAFFSNNARSEDVSNNLSESFNKTIKGARKMPVLSMLEEIRTLAMKRIRRRFCQTSKCLTRYPPSIMKLLEDTRVEGSECKVIQSSENAFEVIEGESRYALDTRLHHCACNQWDLTGIPCRHAIYVLNDLRRDPANYVDPFYTTCIWQDTYKDNIKPVNGERFWEKTNQGPIDVPEKRKKRGRPKNFARIKAPQESKTNPGKVTREGRKMHCSNCREAGHTKAKCKKPIVPKKPTGKRGRPRKIPLMDEAWNVQNAPKAKKTKTTKSKPQPKTVTDIPQSSSAPEPTTTSTSRGRGRGRGRGKSSVRAPQPPREHGVFMNPFTDGVFETFG